MYRDRVAEDIFVFTSDLYAQVTAGAIVTPEGAVVIDTLPFPEETKQILDFVNERCPAGIRYLILTHYHIDHTSGTSLFNNIPIISHVRCREMLLDVGAERLEDERKRNPELLEVELVLPDIVFAEGQMTLRLGKKTIVLAPAPGHTPDGIVVYVKEDKILFAADMMTPVPFITDGEPHSFIKSLRGLEVFAIENIVQGHGEMILRGEVHDIIESNIAYINLITAVAADLIRTGKPREAVLAYDVEMCGKSRIPLFGLVQEFHFSNLLSLYDRMQTDETLQKHGLQLVDADILSKLIQRETKPTRKKAKSKRKTKTKAQTRVKAKPESQIRAKAKVKTRSKVKSKTRSKTKTKVKAKPKSRPKVKSKTKSKRKTRSKKSSSRKPKTNARKKR